jgi:hypothetical protein
MTTLSDIFDALPPSDEVAQRLGITDRAVRAWKLEARRSIPGRYWHALVELGHERGIGILTFENLAAAHRREVA